MRFLRCVVGIIYNDSMGLFFKVRRKIYKLLHPPYGQILTLQRNQDLTIAKTVIIVKKPY